MTHEALLLWKIMLCLLFFDYPLEEVIETVKENNWELLYMLKTKNIYHDK